MFAFLTPPSKIDAQLFCEVTSEFAGKPIPSMAAANVGHTAFEGPCVDRGGNLYFVDISRIWRADTKGTLEVAVDLSETPGGAVMLNGMKIHKDGRLFCATRSHGVVAIDPKTGHMEILSDGPQVGDKFRGLNDLTFASNGDLYFTDQGRSGLDDPSGKVYRLTASGRIDLILDRLPSPNGLVLSSDERTLYVAMTKTNSIWRVGLTPGGQNSSIKDGSAGNFIQMSGGSGPDGMARCEDGSLVVAHHGFGIVWVFNALGMPTHYIDCGDPSTTNIAFGGENNRTLYITQLKGRVLRAEMPLAGALEFSHM